jgi:hypothetical protein
VYMRVVMEQGKWDFIKRVFKKSCSIVFGHRRSMRRPDAK